MSAALPPQPNKFQCTVKTNTHPLTLYTILSENHKSFFLSLPAKSPQEEESIDIVLIPPRQTDSGLQASDLNHVKHDSQM